MTIWRLIPVDLKDPNWEASSHRAAAVVRAPDERTAREAAEAAFGIKTRFAPGEGTRLPPWTRADLVQAIAVEHPVHSADGPTEVLEPSFNRELQAQQPPKQPKPPKRRG